ncbi:MAG: acetyl-CoA decarbonylase/synthase complex subunit delta [Deltaproteobacteria bacterium]|nr:acetyl-CoA decarbonylase/synthase complex subunit delta [Deltaproteobacteria bacterium]MBW2285164.1 acetyl-CoA decarbonylase/synthase complex subunit delta [Deltaproteobacteria bacterium]
MKYTAPLESHSVKIRETILGLGEGAVKIGGEDAFPCHLFEGSLPNQPAVALEILDMRPENWVQWVTEPYGDVLSDPAAWAVKCVEEYGAQTLFLRLQSTDPMGMDATAASAAETATKVLDAVDVPLIVWGTGNEKKDSSVLTETAKACSGKNIVLGPVLKGNYEEIANAAMEHGQAIVAQASMDANLTKELNIVLCKFFPADKIIVDPTASALGYGLEYTFSIIESIKLFGLVDKDNMMQMPIFADAGVECWRTKEAKESKAQGVLWEAMTALTFLLAGANLLVLRHPESLRLIKELMSKDPGS